MVTRSTTSTTRAPTALTRLLRVCWNVQASRKGLYVTEIWCNSRECQCVLIKAPYHCQVLIGESRRHEMMAKTVWDTMRTSYLQCEATRPYTSRNQRHGSIAIPYRDPENEKKKIHNEDHRQFLAWAQGRTCTRRTMMREANAQQA